MLRTPIEATGLGMASLPGMSAEAPIPEIAGPRKESFDEVARLLAARRGNLERVEETSDSDDPDRELTRAAACCPARTPPSPTRH